MKFVLTVLFALTASFTAGAATIGSYANLPGGGMGEFRFGEIESAEIYFQGAGSLVMRGKTAIGEQTVCIISADLAKKYGSDLASILTLVKLSPTAEILCQNEVRNGSLETASFTISSLIKK